MSSPNCSISAVPSWMESSISPISLIYRGQTDKSGRDVSVHDDMMMSSCQTWLDPDGLTLY